MNCADESSGEPVCLCGAGCEARAPDHGRRAATGRKPENAEADAHRLRRAGSRLDRVRFHRAGFDRRRQGRQQAPQVARRRSHGIKSAHAVQLCSREQYRAVRLQASFANCARSSQYRECTNSGCKGALRSQNLSRNASAIAKHALVVPHTRKKPSFALADGTPSLKPDSCESLSA